MHDKLRFALLTGLLAGSLGLTSCAVSAYRGYRIGPPPPARYGVVGYAPGPGYVWCDGYWNLRGRNWVWASGYWARPPRPQAVWVRPYWEPHGRGYRFHRGYWRR